jgi:hypothetical protein
MRDKDRDNSRPRPKKKVKQNERSVPSAPLWIALLGGGAVAGLLVVGLLIWGIWWLFTGGSPVVAQARPADQKAEKKPVSNNLPLEQIPSASGWKVTPDGLPLASDLTSAVVLPEGRVEHVLFSDPSPAQSGVIVSGKAKSVVKDGDLVAMYPLEWAQVDLKSGKVAEPIRSLGEAEVGVNNPLPVINAALSPSGERLALVVATGGRKLTRGNLLQVWDRSGKKLMELKGREIPGLPKDIEAFQLPGQAWLAFVGDSRLLAFGAGKLFALDVPSGKVAYTTGTELKQPIVLSPGRKWIGGTTANNRFQCFSTADGSAAGEIAPPAGMHLAGFSPDGSTLALSFGDQFAFWDVSTGKPTGTWPVPTGTARFRVDRPSMSINWFGGDYLMLNNRLLDDERKVALSEYNHGHNWVAWSGSPDGRLWAAGNFKELMSRPERDKILKAAPGPITDAALQGKNLLAAGTVPTDEVKERLQATLSGINFRSEEPVRIEVTGSGSTAAKQALADAAAEELAKRGKSVDPSAKVGVRIHLSRAKREQVSRSTTMTYMGKVPPSELKSVYRVEASVYLINRENGSKAPAPGQSVYIGVNEANWETVLCKGIGRRIGKGTIPLEGSWTSGGEESGLPAQGLLGIDGVTP